MPGARSAPGGVATAGAGLPPRWSRPRRWIAVRPRSSACWKGTASRSATGACARPARPASTGPRSIRSRRSPSSSAFAPSRCWCRATSCASTMRRAFRRWSWSIMPTARPTSWWSGRATATGCRSWTRQSAGAGSRSASSSRTYSRTASRSRRATGARGATAMIFAGRCGCGWPRSGWPRRMRPR